MESKELILNTQNKERDDLPAADFLLQQKKTRNRFWEFAELEEFLAGQFFENGIRCCSKRKSPAAAADAAADFWT